MRAPRPRVRRHASRRHTYVTRAASRLRHASRCHTYITRAASRLHHASQRHTCAPAARTASHCATGPPGVAPHSSMVSAAVGASNAGGGRPGRTGSGAHSIRIGRTARAGALGQRGRPMKSAMLFFLGKFPSETPISYEVIPRMEGRPVRDRFTHSRDSGRARDAQTPAHARASSFCQRERIKLWHPRASSLCPRQRAAHGWGRGGCVPPRQRLDSRPGRSTRVGPRAASVSESGSWCCRFTASASARSTCVFPGSHVTFIISLSPA